MRQASILIDIIYFSIYYSRLIHFFRRKSQENRVLFYHYVDNMTEVGLTGLAHLLEFDRVDCATLDKHIGYLKKYFKIVKLEELVRKPRAKRLAALSFDDGFKSVYTYFQGRDSDIPYTLFLNSYFYQHDVGLPIHNSYYAKKHNIPIGIVDAGGVECRHRNNLKLWADLDERAKTEISNLYIPRSDIEVIKRNRNIDIGGHSHSHYRLLTLTPAEQVTEITWNKHLLESMLQRKISVFAYPFGVPTRDYDQTTSNIVKESGFHFALSASSVNTVPVSAFGFPRLWGGNKTISKFACQVENVLPAIREILPHTPRRGP